MKENVLEVKIVKMNDEYSCLAITKQDDTVIERGKFMFKANNDVEISSSYVPQHGYSHDAQRNKNNSFLFIGGLRIKEDYTCLIIPNEEIPKIEEAIAELNEKYGKPKPWRAKEGKGYYTIIGDGSIDIYYENLQPVDERRYKLGNYFKTQKQAIEALKRLNEMFKDYRDELQKNIVSLQ